MANIEKQSFVIDSQSAVPISRPHSLLLATLFDSARKEVTTETVHRLNTLAPEFEGVPLSVSATTSRCMELTDKDILELSLPIESVDVPWTSTIIDNQRVLLDNILQRVRNGGLGIKDIFSLAASSVGTYLLHVEEGQRETKLEALLNLLFETQKATGEQTSTILRLDMGLISDIRVQTDLHNLMNKYPNSRFELHIEPSYGVEGVTNWAQYLSYVKELALQPLIKPFSNRVDFKASIDLKNSIQFARDSNVLELLSRTLATKNNIVGRVELAGFSLDRDGNPVNVHSLPWQLPEGYSLKHLSYILQQNQLVNGTMLPITIEIDPRSYEEFRQNAKKELVNIFV
jgi:hypothetical protein